MITFRRYCLWGMLIGWLRKCEQVLASSLDKWDATSHTEILLPKMQLLIRPQITAICGHCCIMQWFSNGGPRNPSLRKTKSVIFAGTLCSVTAAPSDFWYALPHNIFALRQSWLVCLLLHKMAVKLLLHVLRHMPMSLLFLGLHIWRVNIARNRLNEAADRTTYWQAVEIELA